MGGGDRWSQDPNGAPLLPDSIEACGDLLVDVEPRASLTASCRVRQPFTVIQTQNRCLTHGACRAVRQRVIRIAWIFNGRPSLVVTSNPQRASQASQVEAVRVSAGRGSDAPVAAHRESRCGRRPAAAGRDGANE